jgi:hypothetical protein
MPLLTIRKLFSVTADTDDLLSGDKELGSRGRGVYRVTACSDLTDDTISINDGSTDILSNAVIAHTDKGTGTLDRDAAVSWVFWYNGAGNAPKITITETTGPSIIAVLVEYLGDQVPG